VTRTRLEEVLTAMLAVFTTLHLKIDSIVLEGESVAVIFLGAESGFEMRKDKTIKRRFFRKKKKKKKKI
jgi:hypothetical protein